MRTLEEVKKELDRRYIAADRKRRRTRRTAAEATLGCQASICATMVGQEE